MRRLRTEIDTWCAGRSWRIRAPALAFLAWVWLRHASDPLYRSVFGGLNLGVHELGHFVFGPFGDRLGALGGSLLQCMLPLVGMAMFIRQRDWFAVAFAWGWLGTNLFEVATYAGDAVAMRLPLVTPGGGHPIHDWNYVLGDLGWLRHTELVAAMIRIAGHASMAGALIGMGALISRMVTWSGPRGAARRAREHALRGETARLDALSGMRAPEHSPGKPRGGGLAARPRETSLRPWSEPDPPGITAPEPSSGRRRDAFRLHVASTSRAGSPESDEPGREAERDAPGRVLDR